MFTKLTNLGAAVALFAMLIMACGAMGVRFPKVTGTQLSSGIVYCPRGALKVVDMDMNGDQDVDVRVLSTLSGMTIGMILYVPESEQPIGGYVWNPRTERVEVFKDLKSLIEAYPSPCNMHPGERVGN